MMRPPSMSDMPDAERPVEHDPALMGFGLRRVIYSLRTEGGGPAHETAAIGIGVFIGCLPFYGLHLVICWGVGTLLRLNRLKLYLAANISNPIVAPFLIFAELQAGSWLRRGTFHPITLEAVKATGVTTLGVDLLLGSVAVGSTLAVVASWGTYATLRGAAGDRSFIELVRLASDRYLGRSITAWEFARGKLRSDPVYRASVYEGLLRPGAVKRSSDSASGATLVDVGCGQGLMLALLAEVRRNVRTGIWSGGPTPPRFDRLIGIEHRPRVAAIARAALGDDAEILTADARVRGTVTADTVLLFDVLHLIPADDQEALLASLAASLEPDGVIVIREADASAGWRFVAVKIGNRLKALAVGQWRQTFHFRSTAEWLACFGRLGLAAEVRPMGQGTPFGNVLFRVHRVEDAAAVRTDL